MSVDLRLGDAVQWANDYQGELFHAALMDAPYEMNFMNKGWDNSGVAFDPETWKAFAKVLHPGAFLFVFAGTINDDLISVAMREAGLRKFHKMAGWVNGAGFPKASRLNHGHPLTEVFKGHRYGLQALKPAIEMVLIFQKPYTGRPVDNITRTGAGVLNVDGGRIAGEVPQVTQGAQDRIYGNGKGLRSEPMLSNPNPAGRWPANFYLGSEEAARRLDEQSGERPSSGLYTNSMSEPKVDNNGIFGKIGNPRSVKNKYAGDSGGASRFFFTVRDAIDDADPVRYVAKASRRERDAGLEGMPLKTSAEITGKTAGTKGLTTNNRGDESGNPYSGISMAPRRNPHPTVKPLSLCRWLATLLLPPIEYAPRRLFVPFAGVGSECIGAMQAGWEFVQGVEITEEYIPIAQARAEYWASKDKQIEMELA